MNISTSELSRYWWTIALRGLFAVLFGLATFFWPGLSLIVLIALFGAYALLDGIFTLITGFMGYDNQKRWWVVLLEGLVGIGVGIMTFFWPGLTALGLLYFIAAWAIVTGVLEILAAIRLRKLIEGEWALILSGIASILFGVLLIAMPGTGVLAVLWLIGAYAIFFGVLMIILAFRIRRFGRDDSRTPIPQHPIGSH